MKFKNFIMATWQLPQRILGFIVMKVVKAEYYTQYKDANVYFWGEGKGGMSLGNYIFVPFKPESISYAEQEYIKHEYGHTIQSKYLGWFFLLVIGLPSLIWAGCFDWYRAKYNVSYYAFYTESWANKLGGVEE